MAQTTLEEKVKQGLTLGDVMEFPITWPGADQATYPEEGYGLCDDEMWASRNGAVGWRTYQSLLPLTVTAGVSLGWAAAADVAYFGEKGQTQSGATGYPATYVLTEAETDAFKDGAMVAKEDEQFFIYAFGFSVSRPFEMDATSGTAPLDTEPTWLRGYARSIQEKVTDKFGVVINWPDTKCEYGLGKLKLWATHSDTVGGDIPATSNRNGFAGVNGVRRPVIAGYRTSEDLIVVHTKAGFGGSWLNDVAFPIPAMAANHSIVVPITAVAYGVSMKRNRCAICVGGEATTVDQLVRLVAARIAKGQ